MNNIGLNLFSIRTLISTEEDFLNTAKKLKEMGYTSLQYSGATYDPARIKRVSEETGLPIVLTHVPMDRIIGETDKLMEEHASFGCKNIGLGAMPMGKILDETEFKKTVELLNAAGEKMQKNGFRFTYHHHHYEFYQHNGQTVLEYILQNAPYINFTVDTYWLQYGGADILAMLDKLKGRTQCVHLKDYKIFVNDELTEMKPNYAPVGDGTLDFKKIVKKMQEIGVENYLVEQDNACELDNCMELIERSVKYVRKEL